MSDEINIKTKSSKTKLFLIIAAIAVVVLTVGAVVLLTSKGGTAKKVEKQLSLGAKYLSELDYEQAVAAYELAIEIDPKSVDAYLGLAEVYIAMGEWDKAEEVLEGAKDAVDGENLRKIEEKLDEVKQKKEAAEQPVATPTPLPTATPEPISTPRPTSIPITEASETKSKRVSFTGEIKALNEAGIGDSILFGTYEQDNDLSNGSEAIEWLVLDKMDGKILVLSKYALDGKKYNEENEAVTWEKCSIRQWLNDAFYRTAFNAGERSVVVEAIVKNQNSSYGTDGANDTNDKVFLLNIGEVTTYFSQEYGIYDLARTAKVTEYAKAQGASYYQYDEYAAYVFEEYAEYADNCWWWLRSSGLNSMVAPVVCFRGNVERLYDVGYTCSVRPALWISLEMQSNPIPTPEPEELSPYELWEIAYQTGGFPEDREWIDELYQMLITDDYKGVLEVLKDDSIAEKAIPYHYFEYDESYYGCKLVTSDGKFVGVYIPRDFTTLFPRHAWYSDSYDAGFSGTIRGDKEVIYYPEPWMGLTYEWFDGMRHYDSSGRVSDEYGENQCFYTREPN